METVDTSGRRRGSGGHKPRPSSQDPDSFTHRARADVPVAAGGDRSARSAISDLWSAPGMPFPGLACGAGAGMDRSGVPGAPSCLDPTGKVLPDGVAEGTTGVDGAAGLVAEGVVAVEPADLVFAPRHRRPPPLRLAARWWHEAARALPRQRRQRALLAAGAGVVVLGLVVGLLHVLGGAGSTLSIAPVRASGLGADGGGVAVSPRQHASASGQSPSPKSSLPPSALQTPTSLPSSTTSSGIVPPAGGSATGSVGSSTAAVPTLTTAAAQVVADDLWTQRVQALSSDNLSALAQVESGAALAGDTAQLQAGTVTVPPASSPQVLVPEETTYPWQFVASEASGPSTSIAVYFKASATASWTITVATTFPTPSAASLSASGTGPASLASLATAWQQWATSGSAPSAAGAPFLPEAAYQSVGQHLGAAAGLAATEGLDDQVTFTPDPAAGSSFVDRSMGLSCGALQETVVFTSSTGGTITQPASRTTWGASLGPGAYKSVTQQSVYEVCLGGSPSGTEVLGGTGGVVSSTGVPG